MRLFAGVRFDARPGQSLTSVDDNERIARTHAKLRGARANRSKGVDFRRTARTMSWI
jgi:hypothetical protein